MKATSSGRVSAYNPNPESYAYADGLTAASYIEPDAECDDGPQGIPQAPCWKEGD